MKCLYCQKRVLAFRLLGGGDVFCSEEHQELYRQKMAESAIERILKMETRPKPQPQAAAPPPEPAAKKRLQPAPPPAVEIDDSHPPEMQGFRMGVVEPMNMPLPLAAVPLELQPAIVEAPEFRLSTLRPAGTVWCWIEPEWVAAADASAEELPEVLTHDLSRLPLPTEPLALPYEPSAIHAFDWPVREDARPVGLALSDPRQTALLLPPAGPLHSMLGCQLGGAPFDLWSTAALSALSHVLTAAQTATGFALTIDAAPAVAMPGLVYEPFVSAWSPRQAAALNRSVLDPSQRPQPILEVNAMARLLFPVANGQRQGQPYAAAARDLFGPRSGVRAEVAVPDRQNFVLRLPQAAPPAAGERATPAALAALTWEAARPLPQARSVRPEQAMELVPWTAWPEVEAPLSAVGMAAATIQPLQACPIESGRSAPVAPAGPLDLAVPVVEPVLPRSNPALAESLLDGPAGAARLAFARSGGQELRLGQPSVAMAFGAVSSTATWQPRLDVRKSTPEPNSPAESGLAEAVHALLALGLPDRGRAEAGALGWTSHPPARPERPTLVLRVRNRATVLPGIEFTGWDLSLLERAARTGPIQAQSPGAEPPVAWLDGTFHAPEARTPGVGSPAAVPVLALGRTRPPEWEPCRTRELAPVRAELDVLARAIPLCYGQTASPEPALTDRPIAGNLWGEPADARAMAAASLKSPAKSAGSKPGGHDPALRVIHRERDCRLLGLAAPEARPAVLGIRPVTALTAADSREQVVAERLEPAPAVRIPVLGGVAVPGPTEGRPLAPAWTGRPAAASEPVARKRQFPASRPKMNLPRTKVPSSPLGTLVGGVAASEDTAGVGSASLATLHQATQHQASPHQTLLHQTPLHQIGLDLAAPVIGQTTRVPH